MRRSVFSGVVIAVAASLAVASSAHAGGNRIHKVWRSDGARAPIKDCTRVNGRWGYYGNPWCTPREQARWDRWSARRQ